MSLFVDEHFEQPRPAAAAPAKRGASAEVLVAESESPIETSPQPTERLAKNWKSGRRKSGRRREVINYRG